MNNFNIQNINDFASEQCDSKSKILESLLGSGLPVKPPFNDTHFFWEKKENLSENFPIQKFKASVGSYTDNVDKATKGALKDIYNKLDFKTEIFETWLCEITVLNPQNEWYLLGYVYGFLGVDYGFLPRSGLLQHFLNKEILECTTLSLKEGQDVLAGEVAIPILALMFLHSNKVEIKDDIGTKRIERLNAKRPEVRHQTTYKVLEITQIKKIITKAGGLHKCGWHNALHTCRGHFRHYKDGKVVWIKSHQKGGLKYGEVKKDYTEVGKPILDINKAIYPERNI